MLAEGAEAGGSVKGPKLEGIVPGGGEEGIAADWIPVDGVGLARVLSEGAHGIGRGRQGDVPEFEGAVGDGGDGEGVVGLGPAAVVDAVGGVEGGELRDGGGTRGGGGGEEVEDVEAAIAEDAEVLGGGDEKAALVEGAESDGVAAEGRLEQRHRRSLPGITIPSSSICFSLLPPTTEKKDRSSCCEGRFRAGRSCLGNILNCGGEKTKKEGGNNIFFIY